MRKIVLVNLATILILSVILPVNASITTKVTVDNSLAITYDFQNIDPIIYDQIKANPQFNISTIPQIIIKNLEEKNQKLVRWGFGSETNIYDDANLALHISFFLGGSDIISFKVNKTTLKRTYQVSTEWRKFQIDLTGNFSVDFAQRLAKPVEEWQKTNATTFYYENKQTGMLDVFFYLILPASASSIQVQGDTVTFDMPPLLEDQLLNSPFLILGVIAVALVIVLLYRKAR